MNPVLKKWLGLSIATAFAAFAVYSLKDVATQLDLRSLSEALSSMSALKVSFAILATIASFATMAVMEWLAARHFVRENFELKRASLFSFIVYGISNTFGFAGLASTPLRLRLYDGEGVKPEAILNFCLLASAAFWLGLVGLLGMSLMGTATFAVKVLPVALPREILALAGLALIFVSVGACRWLAGRSRQVLNDYQIGFPSFRILLTQSALAALDWLFAGLALYALLPDATSLHPFRFLSGFLLSQVAALVSSLPGGIGVLEGFSLYLLDAPKSQVPQLAAAFVAYRSLYYLPPLVMACAMFAMISLKRAKDTRVVQASGAVFAYGRSIVPLAASLLAGFVGVSLLLVSGQTFAFISKLSALPPFWQSLAGTALLILALGLYERSSSARKVTMVLMGAIFLSALAGLVWGSALLTGSIVALLYFNEREFYRQSALGDLRGQLRFSAVVIIPTVASMALALFSYFRQEVDAQQWWKFTFDSGASAFLRGSVGSMVALGGFGLWSLLSPRRRPEKPLAADSKHTFDRSSVEQSPYTTACLALVGDKEIFRAEGLEGFIMYKVAKPFWIAMGDPVASSGAARAVMTAFLAECDRVGAIPVFYQTRPETLSHYVEVGFQAVKIGEEARVRLNEFSLEGRERKGMRNTCSRIEREGYKFELLSRAAVPARLPELRKISTDWLERLSMREKGFSVGYFSDEYLSQNDVAVVSKNGEIVAFANLWLTGSHEEFSVDLMRYSQAAPSGVMEYLIIQLLLHAKSEGYSWFNLGMAPLAGLEGIHSGRQWHRVGTMIYRAGEAFYNFRGLKAFKDKFGPAWESRFLVYPPGVNLARVLSSTALLINFTSRVKPSALPTHDPSVAVIPGAEDDTMPKAG